MKNIYRLITSKLLEKLSDLISGRWIFILVLAVILTGLSVGMITKLHLDTNITHLLPDKDPTVADFNEANEQFGFSDKLIILIKDTGAGEGAIKAFMGTFAALLDADNDIERVEYKLPHIYFDDKATRAKDKFNVDYSLYVSPDGREYIMFAYPKSSSGDIDFSNELMDRVVALEEIARQNTAVVSTDFKVEYGGGYPITLNESINMKRNILVSLITSLLSVLVLFFFAFRRPGIVIALIIPLLMAIIWTLALASVVIGSLNVMTVSFAAILLGLGVDFGIHVYNRFILELSAGEDIAVALRSTLLSTGESVFFSCITTSAAFYSLMIMQFDGASQFGFLIGTGVIFCMLAMLLVLPSIIVMTSRGIVSRGKSLVMGLRFIPALASKIRSHSKPVAIAVLSIIVIASLYATVTGKTITFDNSLDSMSSMDNSAIDVQKDILKVFGNYYEPVVVFAKGSTPEESMDRLKSASEGIKRLNDEGELVKYESLFKYLPSDSEKEGLIDKIRAHKKQSGPLSGLFRSIRGGSDLDHLLRILKDDPSKKDEYEFLLEKQDAIEELTSSDLPEDVGYNELNKLMPKSLSEKFFAFDPETGAYYSIAYLYPKDRVKDTTKRDEIISVLGVDDNTLKLTGISLMVGQLESIIKTETKTITSIIGIVLVFLLFLIYRKPLLVLISMAPVALSLAATLCTMAIFGIEVNYMNIIAFPIIIGMGVDDGIHMLHRYYENNERDLFAMINDTGRAVVLTSLTTMIGFGSLILSRHNGLVSLGLVTSIGIGYCLISSLLVLPGLITFAGNNE